MSRRSDWHIQARRQYEEKTREMQGWIDVNHVKVSHIAKFEINTDSTIQKNKQKEMLSQIRREANDRLEQRRFKLASL